MDITKKIYVAGHRGLVGSAIVRRLEKMGATQIITRTSTELDLRNQLAVEEFFAAERPEYVFVAAAKVGGIHANNIYRADFLFENLQIQNNVIWSAFKHNASKLIFLGSSCIYPKFAEQPIKENSLLTGTLEPTNEPYAIAKIAGLKLCETLRDQYGFNAISAMPTNLYGPYDNFNLQNSHVLPAMMRKFHEAKIHNQPTVTLWGNGTPMREFLHADDAASGIIFLMQYYEGREHVNVGTGLDETIRELAEQIRTVVGYDGEIVWDTTKPNGTPRKVMDVSRIHGLGWHHSISLSKGIEMTYEWFRAHYDAILAKEA